MRVLFVTAYFPPCQYGWGYMRICEQVADGLSARGHKVAVLTSTYQDGPEVKPYPVFRQLRIDPDWVLNRSAMLQFFWKRRQREKEDQEYLVRLVKDFQPDIVFLWHCHGLSRIVLQTAEMLQSVKTVYYFANYLPELADEYSHYWQTKANNSIVRLLKTPVAKLAMAQLSREGKPIILKYSHSISVSHYVKERLRPLIGKDAVVIPNGIDIEMFHHSLPNDHQRRLRCIIAGRIAPEKGIHTVIQALKQLALQDKLQDIQITIIGSGPPEYRHELEMLINQLKLSSCVIFVDPVSIEEMPKIFSQHHILLLPSEWEEPLSCTMLEAMSAGLMVIGTTTGGSGEALIHDQTGLTFTPGDASELAVQLERIIKDRDLVTSLAKCGQQKAEAEFDMELSVQRIEKYLANLVQANAR